MGIRCLVRNVDCYLFVYTSVKGSSITRTYMADEDKNKICVKKISVVNKTCQLKLSMNTFLVYCSICCWMVLSTDGVTLTLEMKSSLPLKGSSLELSCNVSDPFNSNSIVVWKGSSQVTICSADSDLCDFYKTGYSFTTNRTGVFGRINSLTTEAEGTWRCSYRTTSATSAVDIAYSNSWNLIVYTITPGLSITQNPNQDVDLSVQSVVLQCKTTGCTYPMPIVQWIFKDQITSSENVYATDNAAEGNETCAAQEKIYTSTLNLSMYTTLNDNSDKTGTFSCRIEYPDSSRNIIASTSHTVRFAVRVTEAVLQHNNQNITETLIVTSAEPVTLTCVTGTSRPAPTIDWYLGSQKIGSGASLTINFTNIDHNEMIYCQAYNTDSNSPASSRKPRLHVNVRVTEAVLQHNNQDITETLIVTSAEPVTLTCVTGISRPAPTIDWYLGSQKIGSGASLTINFTNMDHNEMIYCQAYNTDPSKPVSSAKPRLFVRGPPQAVSKFDSTRFIENQIELQFQPGFNGGHVQTFVIQYKSTTEPDMAWKNSSVADLKETQIQLHNGVCFVNVTQPGHGKYMYRMYSWNEKGRSPFSAEITVILTEVKEQQGQSGPSIAGIAGGIGAAVVVLAAIIVVFVVFKRRNKSNLYDKADNHPSPSARTGAVGTEYAVVVRHKHHPKAVMEEDPNVAICESATILKRSTSQENVYENSNAKVNSSGNYTYENPGDVAAKGPEVSKDGLLYADVILGPPSTIGGKPVIHLLEDRTVYADIDYGKRGKPLPESDEEKGSSEAKKNNCTQMNIDK